MRSPANATRAFELAATLEESLYRRWPDFHRVLHEDMGGFPSSTLHGGGRSGGGPSDPTGRLATNPRSDPARADLAFASGALLHAAQLFVGLEETVTRTLALPTPPRSLPAKVADVGDARRALDAVAYVIEAVRERWKAFHHVAGDTMDRTEAYRDLDQAIECLGQADDTMCRREWLGGDPLRLWCQNARGCPDGNPPARDHLRCWACRKHLQRYGEERTRAPEGPVERLSEPAAADTPPEGSEPVLLRQGAVLVPIETYEGIAS